MYEVMIQESFSAAHRLRDYGGRCEELHGHNWKVEVVVRALELDRTGLALDFSVLRKHTKDAISSLDHCFLNDLPAFKEMNPSSENIARFLYHAIEKRIKGCGVQLARVNVWESDHSRASYVGPER